MKQGKLFGILVLTLLMVVSIATDTMGQGRGRRVSRDDRKCAKFVNCHDARDGRLDGRGPDRRSSFRRNRRNRDRDFDNIRWRRRDRDRDDDIRSRRRNRDRDSNDDRSWRRRR